MPIVQGHATIQGTQNYFARMNPSLTPIALGKTDLLASRIGFGSYRVTHENSMNRQALHQALLSGCNLIDTSANYWFGDSEVLVGQALGSLIDAGDLNREEVIIVTKAGYLQGPNLERAIEREKSGHPFTDMVFYSQNIWHCISPDFLEDQIGQSLERMGLETIDVLLLHNPEYYLQADGNPDEYYRRIEKAFRYLETEVKRGSIKWYGISSNTFPDDPSTKSFTSLERVIAIANSIGDDNHFAVIQFPFNLLESGAALLKNQGGQSTIELASKNNIGTLANRPLNALKDGNSLYRLADTAAGEPTKETAIQSTMEKIAPSLKSSPTISRQSLRSYLSVPGLDTVLVGMRKPDYVTDSLGLEGLIEPNQALEILSALSTDSFRRTLK